MILKLRTALQISMALLDFWKKKTFLFPGSVISCYIIKLYFIGLFFGGDGLFLFFFFNFWFTPAPFKAHISDVNKRTPFITIKSYQN